MARAQAPEHIEARLLRQADVEDQQIEVVGLERAVGIGAVAHDVDGEARVAQRVLHGFGQDRVVLRDEYAHASPLGPV